MDNVKYLGATLSKDGTSTAEVRSELPQQQQRWPDCREYGRATSASKPNPGSTNYWSFHTPVWLRGLDSPGRHRKANSGLRLQMPEKATEDLLPGPQNQQSRMIHSRCTHWRPRTSSCHCEKKEIGVVWSCNPSRQPLQEHHARQS